MKATMFLIVMCGGTLAAGGCSKWYTTNTDEAIARAWAPSNFLAPAPAPIAPADYATSDPGPLTPTLDRTDWETTTIIAHSTQPQHQPIFTRSQRDAGGIPRNAGKFPTASTALDSITTKSTDAQVGEALYAPLAAAGDIVLFPIRIFKTGMWKTVDNGLTPFEREPGSSWQRAAKADLLDAPVEPTKAKK